MLQESYPEWLLQPVMRGVRGSDQYQELRLVPPQSLFHIPHSDSLSAQTLEPSAGDFACRFGISQASGSFPSINLPQDLCLSKWLSTRTTAIVHLHYLVSHGRYQYLILPLLNAHLAPMAPGASTRDHRHGRHVRERLVPGPPNGQANRRNRLGHCRATNRREPRTACVSPCLLW